MTHHLAIIGAGPKGIAICARAALLASIGKAVPQIAVFEKQQAAAQWNGSCGYTDGQQRLGTSPEKDVGYPYPQNWGPTVARRMQRFSWQAFNVQKGAYTDWIDRGRPQPLHREWAEYLTWVLDEAREFARHVGHGNLITVYDSEVTEIGLAGSMWTITSSNTSHSQVANGLVVTGHGEVDVTPIKQVMSSRPGRVFTGKDFWSRPEDVSRIAQGSTVAVIGSGETAAAIVAKHVERFDRTCRIRVVNRQRTIFSRNETYHENRFYSDPTDWELMSVEERDQFLKRTDKSVVSQQYAEAVSYAEHLRLQVVSVEADPKGPGILLKASGASDVSADYIVWAAGFDPLWFRGRMTPAGRAYVSADPQVVRRKIEYDLGVAGLPDNLKLHLPIPGRGGRLAGMARS